MPKSFPCPHCKAPILDDTADLVAEAVKPLIETIKSIPTQFPKPTELPPLLAETLQAVASAGKHMEITAKSWEAQRLAEAEATKETPGHTAPTPELIEEWRKCPDCAPGWQKIWDGIAASARAGYFPSEEVKDAITEVAVQLTGAKKGA